MSFQNAAASLRERTRRVWALRGHRADHDRRRNVRPQVRITLDERDLRRNAPANGRQQH